MMGNLGFDQSSGAIRRLDQKGKKAEFTYWVFDAMSRDEWEKKSTRPLSSREQILEAVFHTSQGTWAKNIKTVPTTALINPTHKQIMKLCEEFLSLGFEGAMAKKADAPYKWGRGDNLLKVKKFFDSDIQVTGFYEGKGKHKGRLGGVYVAGTINSRTIKSEVGSGFDDKLREEIWNNQKEWLGATVQIQYQEITPKDSLRFPVFIMRRKDKE